jgi:hypothetical protein
MVVAWRWSWVLVLVVGLALFEAVQHATLVTDNTTPHLRYTYWVGDS